MTTSRSTTSTSRAWIAPVIALLLLGAAAGRAEAGRKRVVVLEFEGEKAERFHADVVKLIKKSHTVVALEKWNQIAEDLSATRPTDRNVKKVAKRLKVDGVVSGSVEKRRDQYILRMKLRAGVSGEVVGSQVNIQAETSRLEGASARDVRDELVEVIADLPSNREGGGDAAGGDDAEAEPEPKPRKAAKPEPVEDDEREAEPEPKPRKTGFGKRKPADEDAADAEPAPRKAAAPRRAAADEEAEEPEPKPRKPARPARGAEEPEARSAVASEPARPAPRKATRATGDDTEDEDGGDVRVAAADAADGEAAEGGGEVEASAEVALDDARRYSIGERAVDVAAGLSFTGRRMAFTYDAGQVMAKPVGYKQLAPVPGVLIDATVFPLAIGHQRKDVLRGVGVNVLFDRVVGLKSANPMGGPKLATTEQRIGFGGVFRYPLGSSAQSPVVGGLLRYTAQKFAIAGDAAIPDVGYSLVQIGPTFDYPISPKLALGVELAYQLALGAGEVTTAAQYGAASLSGIEGGAGVEYKIMKNVVVRGAARVQTIGYKFKGGGMKSMGIAGARDTYFGGSLTAGYLF
jgi:hypothetical protein